MSNINDLTKKVLFQTFEDWGRWDEEFQTKATSLHLWGCHENLMEKHERPEVRDYHRGSHQGHQRQTPRQECRPGTADDLAKHGCRQRPAIQSLRYEGTDPHLCARTVSDLTAENKSTFMFEWRAYEQDYREYLHWMKGYLVTLGWQ